MLRCSVKAARRRAEEEEESIASTTAPRCWRRAYAPASWSPASSPSTSISASRRPLSHVAPLQMSGKINNWQGGGYSGRAVFSERVIQEYGVFRKMGYSGRWGIRERGYSVRGVIQEEGVLRKRGYLGRGAFRKRGIQEEGHSR